MNKFRNNLHAAFFEQGMSEKQQYYPDAEMLERERVAAELEALRAEEAELMRSVEGVNLPDIAGEVLADIPDDDTEGTAGKKDVFQHRIADKPEGSEKTYEEIWANKITLGLGALITKLEESNYFDDCADQAAKDAKIAQVKQQYFEEVKKEYKENVFDADEMTFNGVKDNLFDRAAEDSITNRMFESLTTAVVDETVEEADTEADAEADEEADEEGEEGDKEGEDEADEDGTEEAEAIKEEDLSEIGKGIIAKVRELYGENDLRFFNSKKERFIKRHDKPENGTETYNQKWERNISEGLTHLMSALEENHYFDGLDDDAKAAEKDRVTALYLDEVRDQYKDDIWNARDKKFDRVKDVIFTNKSEDYPANKIYTKLTGAATISKVERQNTEGYDISLLDSVSLDEGDDSSKETMSDRQNRRFLSNDLPKYLWDIRKTPGILNVMKWLPIFSVKVDRPSEVDRDAISDFIKAANRIPTKDGKDPAMVLLESLHDNRLNTNSTIDTYVDVLVSHGMDLDAFKKNGTEDVDYKQFKKCVSKVMEVGKFYITTQSADNDIKDQHAIYLSVLKIIETSGGIEEAAQKFKNKVEQSKKDKKMEKKEGYESGEKLKAENPDIYDFVTKLGVTDYTSATRLSTKDVNYFKDFPVEQILANINNDRIIDARDTMVGGTKTGGQFLETFNRVKSMIGEDKVFDNLLNHAKLINQTLDLGLDESRFTTQRIKEGDYNLILLLQDIISKPGEDLISLMLGETGEERVTRLNAAVEAEDNEIREKAAAEAKKFVEGINYAEIKQKGLKLPTPEEMQSGLAATLYSEYKRGVGLGGKISFDDWVKGLELNTGVQVREDGKTIIGIGLDYHKVVNLGKGWTLTPELAAGAFIPLFDANPDGSAGISVDIAKSRLTPKGTVQSIGLNTGVTYTIAGVTILSAGIHWDRDKAAGIERESENKKGEMQQEISTVLEMVRDTVKVDRHVLDLTNPNQVDYIKSNLQDLAKRLNVSEKDIPNVVDATMRLLAPYNGVDLSQSGVVEVIASGVAEQFAMAWSEYRKAHVSESTYLSGAGLGAFWVVGSPLVGVYASMKWTKHDLDGYGDRRSQTRVLEGAHEQGEWNNDLLDQFNRRLGLSEKDSIKLVDGMMVIPSSTKHLVRVNTKMKGHMQKDALGNVKLLPQTPMSMNLKQGAATQGKEIVVGGSNEGDSFQPLDTLGAEWFTDGDIVLNDVLSLSDALCTEETLNNALEGIKAKLPEGDVLKDFDFSKLPAERLAQLLEQINAIDKSKKVRVVLDDNNGVIDVKDPVEGDPIQGNDGRLELVYRSNFEMIDPAAEEVSKLVYAETAKVVCPVLHRMCHGKSKWPEYVQFANLMNEGKYADAKPLIINILNRLDKEVDRHQKDKVDFDQVADKINAIDDPIALGQALMSVNNIFARSIKVFGNGNDGYEFKAWNNNVLKPTSMGRIIAEREMQIRGTVDRKVSDPAAKQAYLSLIDASKRYREANRDMFNVTESKSAQLGNTVGFNLGNSVNPENPLFNPDIYAQTVDLKALEDLGFDATQREALHKHTMELFANNPVLINPILKALGLEGQDVTVGEFSMDGEKGRLMLDIGGKKVTLSADMKFGYFTQCVNHTVVLDSIGAITEDGESVNFGSDVWREGKYKEGNKSSIVSTTEVGVTAAVTFGKEKKQEQTDSGVKTDDATDGGKQFETNPSGTDPVPTDPTPAGPGTTTVSGGDEF